MTTLGQRLRGTIEEWGSIRRFQREMEARLRGTEVRGFTYPSINGYLKGEALPSLEFLREAAQVLGVRDVWLITGEGERTEGERRTREIERAVKEGFRAELVESLREVSPWVADGSPLVQSVFWELLRRWVAARSELTEPVEDEILRVARKLNLWIHGPQGDLGVGVLQSVRERDDYIVAMLQAMMRLIPDPGSGRGPFI